MNAVLLSHVLDSKTPSYGGLSASIQLETISSIAKGDSASSYHMKLRNHVGTHVDCPAHFFAEGSAPTEYDADTWLFTKPQLIDVRPEPGDLLSSATVAGLRDDADLILFRSGWSERRHTEDYQTNNPGIHPELAARLRRVPGLRAIGIDWVSISSFAHRETGREAHRILLDPNAEGSPLLLIEDMVIPKSLREPLHVIVAPLLVAGIDSAPCTVFALCSP